MDKAISGLLLIVAVIHLLPVTGVLGPERLQSLYGVSFAEPNLEILMRHRAVLFGILGAFFVYAAFTPSVRPIAYIAGFVSLISFMGIAWSVGDYNDAVRRVFIADVVALVSLVLAVTLHFFSQRAA